MESKVIYEISASDLKDIVEPFKEDIRNEIPNKHNSTIVDSKAACSILRISEKTLQRYVASGFLETEPRQFNGNLHFSLGYLLKIDITTLRKQMRNNI